ncbi:MAG: Holliday junction resolvase RecU [Culicoidibacterales bacterium]
MNVRTIKYPTKSRSLQANSTAPNSTAKRGMSLEHLINQANAFYLHQGKACVHKRPTPIQVVSVDYKSRSTAKITEAYYTTPSTTDYNGVFNGLHIDFEAKQTNLTALPFHNFHSHQIEHMESVIKQNGICFVIIYFAKKDTFYLIPAKNIIRHYKNSLLSQKRKSFGISLAEEVGYLLPTNGYPILDYLTLITENYIGGEFIVK